MRGKSILRPSLLRQAFSFLYISSSYSRIPLNRRKNHSIAEYLSISVSNYVYKPSFADPEFAYHGPYPVQPEPPPAPENVIRVSSEEELNAALSKTEQESASAVFYFTTASCRPCQFIGLVVNELARRTPDVIIYKMYIDEEHIASRIKELNVTSVPTLHYFKEGKKVDEVVGGNGTSIVQTMWDVYDGILRATKDLYNIRELKPEEDSSQEEEVKEEIDAEDIENIEIVIPKIHRRNGSKKKVDA